MDDRMPKPSSAAEAARQTILEGMKDNAAKHKKVLDDFRAKWQDELENPPPKERDSYGSEIVADETSVNPGSRLVQMGGEWATGVSWPSLVVLYAGAPLDADHEFVAFAENDTAIITADMSDKKKHGWLVKLVYAITKGGDHLEYTATLFGPDGCCTVLPEAGTTQDHVNHKMTALFFDTVRQLSAQVGTKSIVVCKTQGADGEPKTCSRRVVTDSAADSFTQTWVPKGSAPASTEDTRVAVVPDHGAGVGIGVLACAPAAQKTVVKIKDWGGGLGLSKTGPLSTTLQRNALLR